MGQRSSVPDGGCFLFRINDVLLGLFRLVARLCGWHLRNSQLTGGGCQPCQRGPLSSETWRAQQLGVGMPPISAQPPPLPLPSIQPALGYLHQGGQRG